MPSAIVLSFVAPLPQSASKPPTKRVVRKLPQPLTSLKDHKFTKMTNNELMKASLDVFQGLTISSEEVEHLEESTRLQSCSPVWSQQRLGRITASNFRKVQQAKIEQPSISLMKTLLHKQTFNHNKVPSLQWGISNKEQARKEYLKLAEAEHINFEYHECGLHVNPGFPHLGATPDGIILCDCCGEGLIEI